METKKMKIQLKNLASSIFLFLVFAMFSNTWAFEIITKEDIRQGLIINIDLIKTADNAIILFDSSSSMNKPYKDTDMSRYEVDRKALMERNEYFPDLGYNIGLYLYTPWKAVYPAQRYDKDKFAKALEALPKKATGATFLTDGLKRLDSILASLDWVKHRFLSIPMAAIPIKEVV